MAKLPIQTAEKLQKILSKRIGRLLTEAELEEAYDNLMGFVTALIELIPLEIEKVSDKNDKMETTPSGEYKKISLGLAVINVLC